MPDRRTPSAALQAGEATPAEVVAAQVRALREARGWSAAEVARRCAEAGLHTLDRSVLAALEVGRRRTVTVEELLVLSYVFDTSPAELLAPPHVKMRLGRQTVDSRDVRSWVFGREALAGQDVRVFAAAHDDVDAVELPVEDLTAEEFRALAQRQGALVVFMPDTLQAIAQTISRRALDDFATWIKRDDVVAMLKRAEALEAAEDEAG